MYNAWQASHHNQVNHCDFAYRALHATDLFHRQFLEVFVDERVGGQEVGEQFDSVSASEQRRLLRAHHEGSDQIAETSLSRWSSSPTRSDSIGAYNLPDCVKEFRAKLYPWAEMMDQLEDLQNGCYDPYCGNVPDGCFNSDAHEENHSALARVAGRVGERCGGERERQLVAAGDCNNTPKRRNMRLRRRQWARSRRSTRPCVRQLCRTESADSLRR